MNIKGKKTFLSHLERTVPAIMKYIFELTVPLSLFIEKGSSPLLPREFPWIQDFEYSRIGRSNGRACALFRDIRPL